MRRVVYVLALLGILGMLAGCVGEQAKEPEAESAAAPAVVMTLLMTTQSDDASARYLAGLQAADMGRLVAAREHFDAAIAADGQFALAHLGRASSAVSLKGFAAHLQHAADMAGDASAEEQALIGAAKAAFDNDLEGSLEKARELTELAPKSPRAWLRLAASQAALGYYEDQRTSATKALELSPGFVPALSTLGNSFIFNDPKDFAKSEEYMQRIVEAAPDEPNSYDLLGDAHRAQLNLEDAAAAYTRAAELNPETGLPLQQRGHVNSFLGNYDQARADYQAAMDMSTDDQKALFAVWKALVSVHAGDSEAGIAELEELYTAIDGMDLEDKRGFKVNALNNVGTIATHHGMTEAARSALDRCAPLMMEQADEVGTDEFRRGQMATIAYFEGMLAARSGDYETAAAKADEFMEHIEPDANPRKNEPAHEVMGLSSLLQGNYEEAVEHYEQTNPGDVYAKYHLGLAYEGAGRTEEAQAIFDEVANNNFNFAGYALIRKEALAKAGASS